MGANKESLTIMETAFMLGTKVSTIKKMAQDGRLNCTISQKGLTLFSLADIIKYIEDNDIEPDATPLFPLETEAEINISYHIIKGDFPQLINYSYLQALLFNRLRVFQVLHALESMRRSIYEIYDSLVLPILDRNIDFYEQDKITHIESQMVRNVVYDSIIRQQGQMVLDDDFVGSVYCAGVSDDMIDPLLKMMDHVLELKGFRVINCGTLLLHDNVEKVFKDFCCPKRLYISLPHQLEGEKMCKTLQNLFKLASMFKAKAYLFGRNIDACEIKLPDTVTKLYSFEDIANS